MRRLNLAIVIIATFTLVVASGCNGVAAKTILKSTPSPDDKITAQVTNFDYGAMAASLTRITVGATDEKDDNRNVMFAVDGPCQIDNVTWVSNRKLHVDYDCPPGMIELAILKKDGITMEYAQKSPSPIHSSFVP